MKTLPVGKSFLRRRARRTIFIFWSGRFVWVSWHSSYLMLHFLFVGKMEFVRKTNKLKKKLFHESSPYQTWHSYDDLSQYLSSAARQNVFNWTPCAQFIMKFKSRLLLDSITWIVVFFPLRCTPTPSRVCSNASHSVNELSIITYCTSRHILKNIKLMKSHFTWDGRALLKFSIILQFTSDWMSISVWWS